MQIKVLQLMRQNSTQKQFSQAIYHGKANKLTVTQRDRKVVELRVKEVSANFGSKKWNCH